MVVCKVVHIRNESSRTFHVVPAWGAAGLFNTTRIGGEPCGGGAPFQVPPGFDARAEALMVPWAAVSHRGLEIGQEGVSERVRCVVGPADGLTGSVQDIDWLRIHDSSWEPLVQERWLALGHRHLLGAVAAVELRMTFTNWKAEDRPGGGPDDGVPDARRLAECIHVELDIANNPANTVMLNVFDLVPEASVPNALLCNWFVQGFGAFHAAVEVYGEEWSFYQREEPDSCGICRSKRPRHHPVHVYRQSVNLGTTALSVDSVRRLISCEVAPEWPSSRYDLVRCNCITFCDELLKLLGVGPVPPWVRSLHETGAALLRVPQFLALQAPNSVAGSASSIASGECISHSSRAASDAEAPLAARDLGAFEGLRATARGQSSSEARGAGRKPARSTAMLDPVEEKPWPQRHARKGCLSWILDALLGNGSTCRCPNALRLLCPRRPDASRNVSEQGKTNG